MADPADYEQWVRALDSGDPRDFERLRIGPGPFRRDGDLRRQPDGTPQLEWRDAYADGEEPEVRAWESQGAGLNFCLEGADPQSVTMPPAPALDRPPGQLATPAAPDGTDPVALDRLFRGVGTGEDVGPYVSQFLLIGSTGVNGRDDAHSLADGHIADGALRIDQRVRAASATNYLTTWESFLDVQNGADLKQREAYQPGAGYRFISRPRDLATYVHYDALYEAYLNATLLVLGLGAPTDPGLPFGRPDHLDRQSGFAQFGPPTC